MGIFEYGSGNAPNDIGSMEQETAKELAELTVRNFIWPSICFIIILGITVLIWLTDYKILGTIGFSIYLFVSAKFSPKPNYDDMGIAGGVIDHPLKYTDDINRQLLGIKILLAPGKVLINPIRDLVYTIYIKKKKR